MHGADDAGDRAEKPEAIGWRVRPSDRAPQKMLVVAASGIAAFVAGRYLFGNFALGVVGFAIIFGSTAEFWLGTVFSVDEKRASVRTGLSISAIEWTDVKRAVFDSEGVKLSPLESPGTMDAFRGVYLRYGDANRDEIRRAILEFGKLDDAHVVDRTHGGGDREPS